MKHQKIIRTVLTVCVLLLSLSLAGCAPDFEGNSEKNADSYILDIEAMNGTDSHTLELEQGDTLQIRFETVKGSLSMEITDPDGNVIYQGDGTEATEFTVDIPADGAYTISVEGKKAQGSIRVDVKKAPALTAEELAGPWHLNPGENDENAINEAFSGAMEFGSGMEISGDGNLSWYIGAEGGSGTYTLDGNTLRAETVSDTDGSVMTLEMKAERTEGELSLIMEARDLTLCWIRGEGETGKGEPGKDEAVNDETGKGEHGKDEAMNDETGKDETGKDEPVNDEDVAPEKDGEAAPEEAWKTAFEKDLFEKYEVVPEYYEDLGDGIYQVYVEIDGKVVPFVAVNSVTGDYHG